MKLIHLQTRYLQTPKDYTNSQMNFYAVNSNFNTATHLRRQHLRLVFSSQFTVMFGYIQFYGNMTIKTDSN